MYGLKRAATLCLLLGSAASAQPATPSFSAARIRADVSYLSDDLLEGRNTGTRGYDLAAKFALEPARGLDFGEEIAAREEAARLLAEADEWRRVHARFRKNLTPLDEGSGTNVVTRF